MKTIDPHTAWQPYAPTDENPWDLAAAAHLYRRAGFGADPHMLQAAVDDGHETTINRLISGNLETSEFQVVADSLAKTLLAGGDPMKLSAAWVYRLLFTPAQLLEKTTLFWHGHFATSAEKVKNASMMWRQNQLLRKHALGDFQSLTMAIAKDPAMLIYLDSATNRKSHPNENFARELMELFCLGEGHYSEADVLELARCFTGWEIKNDRFRKNKYQQDRNEKTVLGISGEFDGEQGIQVVVDRIDMPLFICKKLYRHFICDTKDPDDALLQTPAQTFRDADLQIEPVIRQMIGSKLFFSQHARTRKIKSPVELVIGLLRSLNGTTNSELIASGLRKIGQGLFYPPNVKGWDGGKAWINSSTLLGRANLFEKILSNKETKFGNSTLAEYLETLDISSPDQAIDHFQNVLMAVPIDSQTRSALITEFNQSTGNRDDQFRHLLHTITTLPEFQLG